MALSSAREHAKQETTVLGAAQRHEHAASLSVRCQVFMLTGTIKIPFLLTLVCRQPAQFRNRFLVLDGMLSVLQTQKMMVASSGGLVLDHAGNRGK